MARYLKNTKTNEVVIVSDDDDARFYELVAERDEDRRPVWAQTGAHDSAVPVHVPGGIPADPLPVPAPQPTSEQVDAIVAGRYADPGAAPEPAPKPPKTAESGKTDGKSAE